MSKKAQTFHPDIISVVKSKQRILEVDYNHNTCEISTGDSIDDVSIKLSEYEVKKLSKALSKFLDFRKHLRETF
jgi:hypothetical protein